MKTDSGLNPGDIRTFQRGKGKAVVVGIGLWAERSRGSGPIHIHMTGMGKKGHTTVTNQPSSTRYHRTLFRDLRRLLIQEKCWPYGDEGEETEERNSI